MTVFRFILYFIFIVITLIRLSMLKNECIFYDRIYCLGKSPIVLEMQKAKEKILFHCKLQFYIFTCYVCFNFLNIDMVFELASLAIFAGSFVIISFLSYRQVLIGDSCIDRGLFDDIDKVISKYFDEDKQK